MGLTLEFNVNASLENRGSTGKRVWQVRLSKALDRATLGYWAVERKPKIHKPPPASYWPSCPVFCSSRVLASSL
ncbi:hypothetical protein L2E82_16825 [Cichorium intybus]|uniref:Uncharacterized protein n=1 Tax=Cichorium intybus TaxID=13427 RepID=A0ACB9F685_CICIN|nr:hypothetical protein L2E82_16825 [Cichorium intybus]